MKRFFILLNLSLFAASSAIFAQTYPLFNDSNAIDIGNIRAMSLVHGDMWYNPISANAACTFPKNTAKNLGFLSIPWMSAQNTSSQLCVSGGMYRTHGVDYWPGPVDTAGGYNASKDWARIWKVSQAQIDSFKNPSIFLSGYMPKDIKEWPAFGNTHVPGASSGVPLIINSDMAPFVDVDMDGIYDATKGDYPKIKGDQMMWWIFNDRGPTHEGTNARPLGVEVRMSAYAYNRSSKIDNVVFYEYEIVNKSTVSYTNFRFGVFADLDLGFSFDDYVGFDSSRRLGVVYNAKLVDGNGESSSYGSTIPMVGVTMLDMPDDQPLTNNYASLGAVNSITNGDATWSDPVIDTQYNHILHDKSRLGQSRSFSLLSLAIDDACTSHSLPGDRRVVLASNDYNFAPNTTKKFAMALVVCDSAGGCPNEHFDCIKTVTDSAWYVYHNPLPPKPITGLAVPNAPYEKLKIYPNPADKNLFVETTDKAKGSIQVFNTIGQFIQLPVTVSGSLITINTASLPSGTYTLIYRSEAKIERALFVKTSAQ